MGAFWQTPAYAAKQAAMAGSATPVAGATDTVNGTVFSTLKLGVGATAVELTLDGSGGLLINSNSIKVSNLPTTKPTASDDWVELWNNGGVIMSNKGGDS